MNFTGLIVSLLLFSFTGWITIWIFIKMLFYPGKPIRFAGLTIQGLFPKKKQLMAEQLAQLVGEQLLSFEELAAKITNPENLQKLSPEIEAHIDHFLREKLKVVFPMLASLMGEKTILQLKDAFLLELESLFPILMKSYMNKLQHDLDLKNIITEKIAGFPLEKFEDMIYQIAKKEFKLLPILGGGLGLVIGIANALVAHLTK